MELIKQIKQTEAEAKEIIEQAGKQAMRRQEEAKAERTGMLVEAEQKRKKFISESNRDAETGSLKEAEKLKTTAKNQFQVLHEQAGQQMAGAVTRVMEYLKSI